MKIWLFRETSYKKILSRLIDESSIPRGMISKVASAIGCQRSYLSQVLHSKVHLTKEQAWSAGRFFALTEEESRYFEILVDHDRAFSAEYRKHLQEELAAIRREATKIEKQFTESRAFGESEALAYFAHWLPSAVHILTSIPQYQNPNRIAEHLRVELAEVQRALNVLAASGLVQEKRGRWTFAHETGYVPKDSSYVTFHHHNWRQLAVDDSRSSRTAGLHYTMVQSMSASDFEVLKGLVLQFIADTKKIAGPSKSELLTALNLDFFQPR